MRSNFLEIHPLLSYLPSSVLQKLIACSPVVSYRKGTTLFTEGEPSSRLYHIRSGRCESYRTLPDGTIKTVEILGPGDYVGEPDLVGHGRYHTSVRVITDSVLQQIESADLRSVLEENYSSHRSRADGPRAEAITSEEDELHSGHIVVGLSLSQRLSARLLVDSLAESLFAETGESVLVLRLTSTPAGGSGVSPLNLDRIIDGHFHRECLPKANAGTALLTLKLGQTAREAERVAPLLSNLSRHFDYILVEAEIADVPEAPLLEFVIQADTSYLFIHPNTDDLRVFENFMDDVRDRARGNCSEMNPVICLASNERVNDQLKLNNGRAHAFLHDCPMDEQCSSLENRGPAFNRDIRQLAREIGRCRIGLALSAGGAKGLAHIGVIQVLEENGIEVDVIAGCSMGAYVASVWALGCDGQYMEKLAREVEGRMGLWKLIDPVIPPRQGFIRGEAAVKRLKKTIGDAHFSDLARPLRIVATNLGTLERVIFSSGEVASAVHASCAIPGVCCPVTIDGEVYIDGGVAEPLPVDVLAEMGIDQIIAVNALPPSSFLKCCYEKEKEQTALLQKQNPAIRMVSRQVNYFAQGNILDIMMSAVHGAQIQVAELACRRASVVLRPLAIDARWHDFNHPRKYIEIGRQVALQHLDELKALVRRKAPRHEDRFTQNSVAKVA